MASTIDVDWERGESTGLVSIGSHRLCLHAQGPNRQSSDPVVIIISGLGSSITSWAAVRRLLSPFIRVYSYDRSGFGQSDVSPDKPTSTTIVAELSSLLHSAKVKPPYILVAHSWGGILSREFVALRPDDVEGLVLVDANQEHTLENLDWRNPAIWAIAGELDYLTVTGLRAEHKLTDEEWQLYLQEESSAKHKKQANLERAEYASSFPILASKAQLRPNGPPILGSKPLCILKGRNLRDQKRLYEAGIKAGYGSDEERARYRELLEVMEERDFELQLEPLCLSHVSQFRDAEHSGHNVQLTEPEEIVDAVRWVLRRCFGRVPEEDCG